MNGGHSREPRGWVTDEAERLLAEDGLRQLVGRRIESVRYAEIAYADPPVAFWPGPGFDSLDYGLELDLDDGTTWAVAWDTAGDSAGIVAFPGWHEKLQSDISAVWDVTDHWRDNGPEDIAAATAIWRRGEPSDLCLVTLVLTSEDGRQAVITLGDRADDGSLASSDDNLAVFFSEARARAAGVDLESEPLPRPHRNHGR